MSTNGKIVVMVFSLIMMSGLYGAENTKKADDASSATQMADQFNSSLGQSPIEQNVYFLGLPTLAGMANFVSSKVASATETFNNAASNDAAFRKLGYPVSDPIAQLELTKSLGKYNTIAKEPIFELRCKDLETIGNRVNYLIRVYKCLYPTETTYGKCLPRPDGVLLVEHCMEHHLSVMPDPLKNLFKQYLNEQNAQTTKACNKAEKVWPVSNSQTESAKAENFSGSINSENNEALIDIFVKIGWPCAGREKDAYSYLQTCLVVYQIKQLLRTLKGRELLQTVEGRTSLNIREDAKIIAMINDPDRQRKFIASRQDFLQKIYEKLPSSAQAMQLAGHCLKHHAYIMPQVLQDDFLQFIEEKQQEADAIAAEFLTKKADVTNVTKK